MSGLWGNDFEIKDNKKKILDKVSNPKKVSSSKTSIKSKTLSIDDKLSIINAEVDRKLGVYKDTTIVIRNKNELVEYVDRAISNGIMAIDTETNNSLDPLTCKLMGACIYTPGMKNAYIPVNHTNRYTGERLDWQITEEDIKEQFSRLVNTKILTHNGKFDYQVLKCTCDYIMNIYWDSMIAAKVLDENEKRVGLKQQYIDKIDSSIEKYSIDELFNSVEYAVVDTEVFALYSATDAYMTYKLYEWQLDKFKQFGSERLFDLFMNIEMPVVTVSAEMELTGISLDLEYSKRLSEKYHKKLENLEKEIDKELSKYNDTIEKWRLTSEANFHPKSTKPNKNGEYTFQKSKSEQLSNPVNLTSPTQLAILLYDILGVKPISSKSPRGTGEDILKKINLPICNLILEQRGLNKLINTYIDKLPECLSEKDNRLHAHFNQYGADTGRFSSSDPNLQNIPSHNNEIRMMFTASDNIFETDIIEDYYEVKVSDDALTSNGWVKSDKVAVGDTLLNIDNEIIGVVKNISTIGSLVRLYI